MFTNSRTVIYSIVAIAFCAATLYHLVAIISPSLFPPSPIWRHAIFVFLNSVGSLLSIRKWKWLWVPFTILTIQQLISHGMRAYEWWSKSNRIDIISILIILSMPVIAAFLFSDFKSRNIKK